jgi:hypothetical protein
LVDGERGGVVRVDGQSGDFFPCFGDFFHFFGPFICGKKSGGDFLGIARIGSGDAVGAFWWRGRVWRVLGGWRVRASAKRVGALGATVGEVWGFARARTFLPVDSDAGLSRVVVVSFRRPVVLCLHASDRKSRPAGGTYWGEILLEGCRKGLVVSGVGWFDLGLEIRSSVLRGSQPSSLMFSTVKQRHFGVLRVEPAFGWSASLHYLPEGQWPALASARVRVPMCERAMARGGWCNAAHGNVGAGQ